jgi:protein-tyrosine phosphatase
MEARVYWIKGPWRGQLAIVPRPRGGDWLEDEVSNWHEAGIDTVVSFLTPDEIAEFDLEAEKELNEAYGIRFISFPIPDRGVPASKVAAASLVHDLEQSLAKGKKIALHCRQSVGRSALIAAYLAVDAGEDPRSAFARIGSARGSKVPDTDEQEHWVEDRAAEDKRTKGERLFETYLRLQGITNYEFEKSYPGKHAKPDYSVMLDREYLFEVKDFAPTDLLTSGAYDPYRRIRQRINDGYKKFKEYKEWPCCLVLYNNNASLIHLESPHIMLDAIYGNYGLSMEVNPELGGLDPATLRFGFHDGGKMMRPHSSEPQNTTISALITLRDVEVGPRKLGVLLERLKKKNRDITPAEAFAETFSPNIDFDKYERQLGVIVWENAFARIPFPRNLFCGPYDERWGQEGNELKRIFVGSEIAALEAIEKAAALLQNAS